MCFPIPAKCAIFNLATFFNFFLFFFWNSKPFIALKYLESKGVTFCAAVTKPWSVVLCRHAFEPFFCRHFLFLREWASSLFFKFAYFVCGAEDAQKTLLTDVIVPSCSTNRFQRSSFVRAWDLETEPTRGPPQTKTGRSQPDQSWNLFARFLEFCAFSSLC